MGSAYTEKNSGAKNRKATDNPSYRWLFSQVLLIKTAS
jgi:hypothetical protein